MKSEEAILKEMNVMQEQIEDLSRQLVENSSKGNWTVVKAIKEQRYEIIRKMHLLEWVIE